MKLNPSLLISVRLNDTSRLYFFRCLAEPRDETYTIEVHSIMHQYSRS